MKYIILLGDGMSDYPIDELGGKTPLQVAKTPNMDYLAGMGKVGLAKTVPDGFPPGSDVANLSAFGYNPVECYTGRAPLEAASIGVSLAPDDVAMRCNLVTLGENPEGLVMKDFSAGHIKTEKADKVIRHLDAEKPGPRGELVGEREAEVSREERREVLRGQGKLLRRARDPRLCAGAGRNCGL